MNEKELAILAINNLHEANNHILHQQLTLPGATETVLNMETAFILVGRAIDSLAVIIKSREACHVKDSASI